MILKKKTEKGSENKKKFNKMGKWKKKKKKKEEAVPQRNKDTKHWKARRTKRVLRRNLRFLFFCVPDSEKTKFSDCKSGEKKQI